MGRPCEYIRHVGMLAESPESLAKRTQSWGGANRIAVFEDDVYLADNAKSALTAIDRIENNGFDIIYLYDSKRIKPLIPVRKIDDQFALNLVKFSSMGAVGYVISNHAMKKLLDDYPLMNMGVDQLMHYYWITGLKTYILTPQTVFHGSRDPNHSHHSYSGESGLTNDVVEWKKANPRKYKMYRLKIEFKNLQTFPSRVVFKYIPQRLAFFRRMKNERNL